MVVACLWLYRRVSKGKETASTKALDDGFLMLFIAYPIVTNKLFAVLNCRALSDDLEVLVFDYSIDCNSPRHQAYQLASRILIVLFSVGVPIMLVLALIRQRRAERKQFNTPRMDYICRRVMTELSLDNLSEVESVLVDLELGKNFGSLINAFRPGMIFFEAADMSRKLVMIGFLTVLELGTTSQVVAGVFLSFVNSPGNVYVIPHPPSICL